jgi:hypothetical protein
MHTFAERLWPPTKTWRLSILWSLGFGFVLQIALPSLLAVLGAQRAAWFAMLPGLLPILWATGGFFAGIAPLGYVLMYAINTIMYALLLVAGFRTCACLRRHYA